jgi:hypothetical protein
VVILIALVPTTLYVAIQMPAFQTFVCNKASSVLSDKINGDISVGNISYALFNRLIVKDVLVAGSAGDTILHVEKVSINLNARSLLSGEMKAKKIVIQTGEFNICKVTPEESNISLLMKTDETQQMKELTGAMEEESEEQSQKWPKTVDIDKIEIRDFKFRALDTFNITTYSDPRTIDWNNIVLNDINLSARNLSMEEDITVELDNLSFKEGNGLNINTFSGNIRLGEVREYNGLDTIARKEIYIDDMLYDDGYSRLVTEYYSMTFDDFSDFSDYIRKVYMGLDLKEGSFLDFRSLRSYTDKLSYFTLNFYLAGETKGTVSNLITHSLKVQSKSRQTLLDFSAHLSGLPNTNETMATFDIKRCYTTTSDIADIVESVTDTPINKKAISSFASGERIYFDGSLNGFFEDFVAFGELGSEDMGNFKVDIICRNERRVGYELIGFIKSKSFDLGRLLNNSLLGDFTCDATISAMLGNESSIDIENISISELGFNNYNYSNILAAGRLADKEFDGRVICSDPNLNFMFHGLFALSGKSSNSLYKFNLALGHADLHALNFDKREISRLKLLADADFTKTTSGDLFGDILVKNFVCSLGDDNYDVGNIHLRSNSYKNNYTLQLQSSFARADYAGTAPISSFISDLLKLTAGHHLSHLFETKETEELPDIQENYSFRVQTYDMRPVCSFLMPGLYVEDRTNINVRMTSDDKVKININSPLLAYKHNYIRDLDLTLDNRDSMITTIFRSGMLQSGNIKGYDAVIKALIKDNSVEINLGFDNGKEAATYANLNASVSFPEPKEMGLNILADFYPSNIVINGENWSLNPSSIEYREKDISVAGFGLSNGDQTIRFDGRLSESPEDTLTVRLNRFDASVANPLLEMPLDIKGFLTGKAEFFGPFSDNKGLLLNIDGEKISIAGDQLGDLGIHTQWNEVGKCFDFQVNNKKNELTPLYLAGSYYPDKKSVEGNLSLDKFSLICLNPLVEGLISDVSGNISANIGISGTLDKLALNSSNGHFDDFNFILDYTKVPYTVNGPFSVSEKGVFFEKAIVTDRYGHEGTLSGGLHYDHFKDMRLNARLNAEHLHGLNTTAADNELYYGRAFATGTVRISGPFRKLLLDMNITTGRNSTVHIPLSSSSSSHTSLLTFVDNTTVKSLSAYDSLQVMNTAAEKRGGYEFAVRMRVNATPDAEVHLEINKALGDVLKTRGSGQLVINTNTATNLFDIKGNYNIDEGSYKFVMMGLASRDFIINPGGTINFTGDVMKSDLNLEAIYRTKASIGTLIADTTSISTRRTVDCGIGITGKLANPELSFSIDIPDLDPTVKGRVESALSTEDKRLKQLLTLLLSGSFIPDEQSGIVNNTTVLYSNASEIMANQLNNVFRQLNIPLDLGFNYQPGEKGRDIFDVAVSTQLFNNRVNINGNIGNRQYMTSNQSDLVGDVDVEIKIDRTGKVRLTLFSHSADQYSNYLDQLQRNGVGISYQEEFDDFRELFRKIFWSRRRREEYAAQQTRVLESRRMDPLQRMEEQKSEQTQGTTTR